MICACLVAPFAGAWIETSILWNDAQRAKGRPLRGGVDRNWKVDGVERLRRVAPFAGAWIETCSRSSQGARCRSPPSRGRGSKRNRRLVNVDAARVAPFAGAWIETEKDPVDDFFRGVAPFAGAWIETSKRGRGVAAWRVAPFAGAWIETVASMQITIGAGASPPSRGRGSKPSCGCKNRAARGSPPSRGRGSKLRQTHQQVATPTVAPFAGAWIETSNPMPVTFGEQGRPLRGGVDRNVQAGETMEQPTMSPPSRGRGSKRRGRRRAVDRTSSPPSRGRGSKLDALKELRAVDESPPSRGRGSKQITIVLRPPRAVAPFAGAWIETARRADPRHKVPRRPLRGGVDRNFGIGASRRRITVAPFAGAWIETRNTPSSPNTASRSPPSRGRGSKPRGSGLGRRGGGSPPSRGRGSKQKITTDRSARRRVAPFAGAWIETAVRAHNFASSHCRPLRGGVDRNQNAYVKCVYGPMSPPSRGRGSKHALRAGRGI